MLSISIESNSTATCEAVDPTDLCPSDEQAEYYEMDSISDSQEALLALQCLLDDLAATREVINHFWLDYQNGTCDMVTVSLTIVTAIELSRRLEFDLRIISKYGGCASMLRKLHDRAYQPLRSMFDGNEDETKLEDQNFETDMSFLLAPICMLDSWLSKNALTEVSKVVLINRGLPLDTAGRSTMI